MSRPKLRPVIPDTNKSTVGNRRSVRTVCAVLLICGILTACYGAVTSLVHHLEQYPSLSNLLFVIGVSCLASITPLMMYIFYQDDFDHVNPLNPVHYFFLCKVTFKAIIANNGKVTSKDL